MESVLLVDEEGMYLGEEVLEAVNQLKKNSQGRKQHIPNIAEPSVSI